MTAVHEGSGRLETMFGTLPYGEGDYLVVPRGTIYRVVGGPGETRMLVIESASSSGIGQCLLLG